LIFLNAANSHKTFLCSIALLKLYYIQHEIYHNAQYDSNLKDDAEVAKPRARQEGSDNEDDDT